MIEAFINLRTDCFLFLCARINSTKMSVIEKSIPESLIRYVERISGKTYISLPSFLFLLSYIITKADKANVVNRASTHKEYTVAVCLEKNNKPEKQKTTRKNSSRLIHVFFFNASQTYWKNGKIMIKIRIACAIRYQSSVFSPITMAT